MKYNSEIAIDISELAIDELFEDSPLKELPFVKIVYSIAKTGLAIRDRHMLKKTLKFIQKVDANNVDSNEYLKYKEKIKNRDKETFRELENVIIILDKVVEDEKALILANLYSAYINKKISYLEFKNLAVVLDNFLLFDTTNLELLYEADRQLKNMQDSYGPSNRLIALGMAYNISGYNRELDGSISFDVPDNDVAITEFGRKFYKYGFLYDD